MAHRHSAERKQTNTIATAGTQRIHHLSSWNPSHIASWLTGKPHPVFAELRKVETAVYMLEPTKTSQPL